MTDTKQKFDLKGILGDLKSMINPAGNTPDPDPADAVGIKLAKLSVMAQALQEQHIAQSKKLAEMNTLFNEVYQDLAAFREKQAAADAPASTSVPDEDSLSDKNEKKS